MILILYKRLGCHSIFALIYMTYDSIIYFSQTYCNLSVPCAYFEGSRCYLLELKVGILFAICMKWIGECLDILGGCGIA
jgi:hypothetical protein